MDPHSGDAAIVHAAIAELGTVEECPPRLGSEPVSAVAVAKVEPEVMGMQRELPAPAQNPGGFRQCAAAVGAAANHTQSAEHRKSVVESLIGETGEPAQVGLAQTSVIPDTRALDRTISSIGRDRLTATTENDLPANRRACRPAPQPRSTSLPGTRNRSSSARASTSKSG